MPALDHSGRPGQEPQAAGGGASAAAPASGTLAARRTTGASMSASGQDPSGLLALPPLDAGGASSSSRTGPGRPPPDPRRLSGGAVAPPEAAPALGDAGGAGAAEERSFSHGRPWCVLKANKVLEDLTSASLSDMEAVVLLVEAHRLQLALDLARRVAGPGRPPIIAALMRDAQSSREAESAMIISAQKALMSNGVCDVVLYTTDGPELRLSVEMALFRLQWVSSCALPSSSVSDWGSGARATSVSLAHNTEESFWEDHDDRFWQSAHRLFPSIPPLNGSFEGEPDIGSRIGSVVIEKRIGCGAHGAVYKARESVDSKAQAVKVLLKDNLRGLDEISNVSREISAMKRMDNVNVVKLTSVLHAPNHIFITMELAGEVNLWRAIHKSGDGLPPYNAQYLMAQLACAVAHCHGRGVAHRDIKPENIGVGRGLQIKLFDFGFAVATDKPCYYKAGTMPFTAPEALVVERPAGYQPSAADVWSSGVVLLEMLCGSGVLNRLLQWPEPVDPARERGEELAEFFGDGAACLEQGLETRLGSALPPGLLELIDGVLEVNPSKRWTAAKLQECEWLADGDDQAGSAATSPRAAAPAGRGSGGRAPSSGTAPMSPSRLPGAVPTPPRLTGERRAVEGHDVIS